MSEPIEPAAVTETAESSAAIRRMRLAKLALVLLVLAVCGFLALRGYDVKGAIHDGLEFVRGAGPVAFFAATALLPALGMPQSVFTMTAGPLFGAQLGTALVVFLTLFAMLVNMTLSYWLASRLLRPVLEAVIRRLGYKLPEVQSGDETDLIVLMRVTPGIPFPAQNYLLGLSRIPFGKYLLISFLIQAPINSAFVIFGDALLKGKGGMAFVGISLIVVLAIGAQLVRKHYGKKRA